MKLRAALLIACLFALSSMAAGSLDALRAESRSLRDQVSAVKARQLEGRTELSKLSERISSLKTQTRGPLTTGSELDLALKRSQELSASLTELSQQAVSKETALENANLALLDGLSGELGRLRAEFDRQSDRAARKNLISAMRKLRAERDALRQTLPAARIPTVDVKPSDDPEELLEQADLLRDNEEKLRRDLKVIEARIVERREEAELDRRVQRFMGEESMFDDGDRRLRVNRTTTTPGTAPTAPSDTSNAAGPETSPPVVGEASTGTTAGTGGAAPFGPFPATASDSPAPGRGGTNEFNSGGLGGLDSSGVRVTTASDARVQVGATRSISGGDDDLNDLEVERQRLQNLASQLKKKADELQKRAADLK